MGKPARSRIGLRADEPLVEAGRRVVAVRARAVFDHGDGLFSVGQAERVHDMRVATRRLRAALEVFAVCFPPKEQRHVLREIRRLARALGERRDCDVQIELLDDLEGTISGSERRAVRMLRAGLVRERHRADRRVASALQRATHRRLADRLERLSA